MSVSPEAMAARHIGVVTGMTGTQATNTRGVRCFALMNLFAGRYCCSVYPRGVVLVGEEVGVRGGLEECEVYFG